MITSARKNVKVIDLEKELLIETELINLDKNKNILKSTTPSVLTDKLNNILKTNSFNYNLENSILKLEKVEFKDIYNNSFNVEIAYLNTITNELVGKDILANLDNKSFNKENEPRIKGRSIEYIKNESKITKGVFTTCKKTDKCPPWQLEAEEVNHNSKKL